jgi:hypothetical protein
VNGFPIPKRDVFLSFALGGLVAFEHYTFILISGGDMVDQNQVVKNLIFMFLRGAIHLILCASNERSSH